MGRSGAKPQRRRRSNFFLFLAMKYKRVQDLDDAGVRKFFVWGALHDNLVDRFAMIALIGGTRIQAGQGESGQG
jgi:hypothetical protein